MPTPNLFNPTNDPLVDERIRRLTQQGGLLFANTMGDLLQPSGAKNLEKSSVAGLMGQFGDYAELARPFQVIRSQERTLPTSDEVATSVGADLSRPTGFLGLLGYPDVTDIGRVSAVMMPLAMKGKRVADDVARVNFPEDVPAPPELTRASTKPGKGGRIIGAPEHVKTRRHERKIINDYLSEAERGAGGRDWYADAAKRVDTDTGNLSGARPGAADQAAAVIGEFSPRATLEANRLAQVRAINQNAVGLPVAAGMAPRNKAAQGLLDTGTFSAEEAMKVGPFSMQVRGLEAPRGVHDVRDLQAFGFDRKFSPGVANHRWMDKMTDEMVVEANKRKLGGFDDWTHEKLQASRWVKHKADEMGVPVESLFNEFGPADDFLRANVFSEAIPSGELVDMGLLGDDAKRAYTANFQRQLSNPEGQNALAQQQGLLAPEQTRFVGEWEGATNPNVVTTILADPAKGADVMSSWSREAIEFHGALEGILGGQADVATSFLRKSKRAGDINAARIPFDRAVTEKDLTSYSAAIRKAMREDDIPGDVIGNYRSGKELEFTWQPPNGLEGSDLTKASKKFRSAVSEASGGRAIEARNSGGLMLSDPKTDKWVSKFTPSEWMKKLQNPTQRARVKEMLPKIAGDLEGTIKELPLTDKGREIYGKTLSLIKSGGLEAVEDAVKQGILPAAILGALLAANQAPQQPAPSQGLL